MAISPNNTQRRVLVAFAALLAALAMSAFAASFAEARPFNGACSGGNNITDAIAGWKKKGVLDDTARAVGQTPGTDGSAKAIVKAGMVKTIVAKGGWVTNFTCKGGKFVKLEKKKYIPAGAVYWVPERLAPKPCAKKRTRLGYQANCGNKQVGNLLVRRPCSKKPRPKPCPCPPPAQKPAPGSCNGDVTSTGGGITTGPCSAVVPVCSPVSSPGAVVCTTVVPPPPPPPPPVNPPPCTATNTCPPSVMVSSFINLNDVPEGKSSGPLPIVVNASHTGSLTVNPDLGGVSLCTSTTKQASVTFTLAAGDNNLCVIYYAPGEASVMEDTITYTAIVTNAGATAKDVKTDVFAITHPIRP